MMKTVLTIAVIAALMIDGVANATFVELRPVDDAYVDNVNTAMNYGGLDVLRIQGDAGGVSSFGSSQRIYLKFDLKSAEIPSNAVITSAVFGIYLAEINKGIFNAEDPYSTLHYVGNDSWQESSINWNNRPNFESSAFEEISKDTIEDSLYYEWNLLSGTGFQWTKYADDLADDDGYISVMLKTQFEDKNTRAIFNSDENAVNKPYLRITYDVIPEPATMALLMMGMGGMVAFRKKK